MYDSVLSFYFFVQVSDLSNVLIPMPGISFRGFDFTDEPVSVSSFKDVRLKTVTVSEETEVSSFTYVL